MLLAVFLLRLAASKRDWIYFGDEYCHTDDQDNNSYKIPSVVAYRDDTVLSGDDALAPGAASPANTITGIRNLIGLRYSDDALQRQLKFLPYRVVDRNDHPFIEITRNGTKTLISPEEVASALFAEVKLNCELIAPDRPKVLIVVPDDFTPMRRTAVANAAEMAGFGNCRVVSEAAAACCVPATGMPTRYRALFFHFSRREFVISVVRIDENYREVLYTHRVANLTGEDFDRRLVDSLTWEYQNNTRNDLSLDLDAQARVRSEADSARSQMCRKSHSQEEFGIWGGRLGVSRLTSDCRDLFKRVSHAVDDAVKIADIGQPIHRFYRLLIEK
jgi:molecular chaperone DnaK (HSP70)